MELGNHSRVGIVGGGPAGSMTAFFLMDLAKRIDLNIECDIFEPRNFSLTGPPGCNMCGGVVSESLVQKLAISGIPIPSDLLVDTIDAYTLHSDQGHVRIGAVSEGARIACIFRGAGPRGAEAQKPIPWRSLDGYLLDLAQQGGVNLIAERVKTIDWHDQRPRITLGNGQSFTYDLLVGAVGLNGSGISMFENLQFGYKPPRYTKAYIAELYFGSREVEQRLGQSMHIFLLNIPRLKFLALTPKGPYATLVVLGENIDQPMLEQIFQAPEMVRCLPPGWKVPVQTCLCQPRIHIGPPRQPYGDRIALVGDCSSSRLYKDGIGAAFKLAKACAYTAVVHGISKSDFQRFFAPTCHELDWDNRLGRIMFAMDSLQRPFPKLQATLLDCVRREQDDPDSPKRLSAALWDTFTGSASYRTILANAVHPSVIRDYLRTFARMACKMTTV
ncbi:MAG: hypothetical protein HQL77_18165 [Magnetococcales bacterium]|nr:hypothetical protein [Magnetococcales bacterium]